jgi:hypothetical protein
MVVLDLPFTTIEQNIRKVVLSDKQWLEENMLCLLSNAVKYSQDHSTVKVSVSLEEVFSTPVFSSGAEQLPPAVRGHSKVGDVLAATMKRFHQQPSSPLRFVRENGGRHTPNKKMKIAGRIENESENEKENSMIRDVDPPRLAECTAGVVAGGRLRAPIVDLSDEAPAGAGTKNSRRVEILTGIGREGT